MPVTESHVAITETLGHHHKFRAVLKQRVEDFVVQEVMLDGEVAKINRLPVLPKKRPLPKAERLTAETVKPPSEDQLSALDALFPDSEPSNAASQAVQQLLSNPIQSSFAILPVCKDKTKRENIHAWIKQHLPRFLSDTVQTNSLPTIRIRPDSAVPLWKRRRSDRGSAAPVDAVNGSMAAITADGDISDIPRGVPLQFKLWKRDCDMNHALNKLAHILQVKASAFAYAGTKDKRGVTTQLVQVRHARTYKFALVNRVLGPQGRAGGTVVIGDVEAAKNPKLGLGDLLGNRFTIALRDLDINSDADEENIHSAIKSLKKQGFINYFGMQRFGSGVSPTHETGFAVLRHDFEDFCRRVLLPVRIEGDDRAKPNIRPERQRMVSALERFGRREISANELVNQLPGHMLVERNIALSFAHDENEKQKYDYRAAFNKLPRHLRSFYGHAVQSYLWNVMASARIRAHRPDSDDRMHAITGDMVLENNLDGNVNFQSKVHIVTDAEEKNRSISVFRVVLPIVGSDVPIPDAPWGQAAREILEMEKVVWETALISELNLKGTFRYLLAKPRDIDYKIVTYTSMYENLIPNGIEHLKFKPIIPRKDSQNGQETQAKDEGASSEAAVKLNSHEDVSNEATVKLESQINCDEIKGESKKPEPSKPIKTEDFESHAKSVKEEENESSITKPRRALILSFTLGTAEYATMVFRELTKQESTVASQKSVQNAVD